MELSILNDIGSDMDYIESEEEKIQYLKEIITYCKENIKLFQKGIDG